MSRELKIHEFHSLILFFFDQICITTLKSSVTPMSLSGVLNNSRESHTQCNHSHRLHSMFPYD